MVRQLCMTAPQTLELREVADNVAEPQPGQVAIAVAASALGLTQLQVLAQLLDPGLLPRVLGHEIVGTVIAHGQGVDDPALGTLVVVGPIVPCGRCGCCLRGHDSICARHRFIGVDEDGGYADVVAVPAAQVFALPADTPIHEAVMLASALPTAVHAVRRARVEVGDTVAVLGMGSIGLLLCQVARACGATTVVGADVRAARLVEIEPYVDAAIDVHGLSAPEAAASIRACCGGDGPDRVFEAAGTTMTIDTAVQVVRTGGTVLFVGLLDGPGAIPFDAYFDRFIQRELTLASTYAYARIDFPVGIGLYAAGRIDVTPLVGDSIGLAEVPEVIARMRETGPGGKRFIVRL